MSYQALFQTEVLEVPDFQIFIRTSRFSSGTFSLNQLYFHNKWHKGLLTSNSWNKACALRWFIWKSMMMHSHFQYAYSFLFLVRFNPCGETIKRGLSVLIFIWYFLDLFLNIYFMALFVNKRLKVPPVVWITVFFLLSSPSRCLNCTPKWGLFFEISPQATILHFRYKNSI